MILLNLSLKNNCKRFILKTAAYVLIASFLLSEAQADLDIVAVTGQSSPDANGVFTSTFGNPLINESGEILFTAGFSGNVGGANTNVGYIKGKMGSLTVLARKGDELPSGNGTYTFPSNFNVLQMSLDDAGNVNALAQIKNGTDNALFALVHFDDEGAYEIVRDNQIENAVTEDFFEFDTGNFSLYQPLVGSDGSVYFLSQIDGPDIPNTYVIKHWDKNSGIEHVIESEDPVVENTTIFIAITGQPRVANADKIAFNITYLKDGESVFEAGLAEWTRSGGHRTIVRHNDVTPDGLSNFTGLAPMAILDTSKNGRVLFTATFQTTTGFGQGIFIDNGASVVAVAIQGDDIGGSILRNGIKGKFGTPGATWFTAQTEGAGTFSLFRADSTGIKRMLTQGGSVPGMVDAVFENVGEIYPNNKGDVLFLATIRTNGLASTGYFMWRDGRVVTVATIGEEFAESTIKTISVGVPIGSSAYPVEKHINDEGIVALQIALNDGRSSIVTYTPPPSHYCTLNIHTARKPQ